MTNPNPLPELPTASILSRRETRVSPWVRLIEKLVEFGIGQPPQLYHFVAPADYIVVLAQTSTGEIPIVQQYRPTVETYTWELPAGLLEQDEDPVEACRRELKEETGLTAIEITSLGLYYTDTGRLENRQHVFYPRVSGPDADFVAEAGMSVRYVRLPELKELIREKQFIHQLHVAVLLEYEIVMGAAAP